MFYAANQLYGVTFKRRTDLPVWQPDVMVYDVFDKDGSQLGLATSITSSATTKTAAPGCPTLWDSRSCSGPSR